MARPPTDEELIRNFTPEEHEFYLWTQELDTNQLSPRDRLNAYTERFPLGHGLGPYLAWYDRWNQRHEDRMRYPMSVDDFIGEFEETNFTSVDSMGILLFTMEMKNTPFVYVGDSTFGGPKRAYGIIPNAFRLWPNINSSHREPHILDTNILAINLDVPVGPAGPEGDIEPSGEDSIRSTTVDDLGRIGGFVFAQLGPLRVGCEDPEGARYMEMTDVRAHAWLETDFVVVVQISRFGQPGSVWVIYNFHEDTGDQYAPNDQMRHIRTEDSNGRRLPHIGRLHESCCHQFTVAKIANSVAELKYPRESFTFNVKFTTERQIVKARLFTSGAHRTMIGPRFVASHLGSAGRTRRSI